MVSKIKLGGADEEFPTFCVLPPTFNYAVRAYICVIIAAISSSVDAATPRKGDPIYYGNFTIVLPRS